MWVVGFEAPEIAGAALPGQFVNLGLGPDLLLRRPFSVYDVRDGSVEVLLRDVGRGTHRLLSLAIGSSISALGPLGNGFEVSSSAQRVAVISGGLGVAAVRLPARRAQALGADVTWVHGARSAADLCAEWVGTRAIWATEDGSRDFTGNAVSALAAQPDDAFDAILACGPNPMLKAIGERWPAAQVAVETYMGCGTGVCLGCAVPLAAGGYDRACREGPVYPAAAVDWAALPAHLHYSVA